MQIGKIVNSTSHIDYACQIYSRGEYHPLPSPDSYAFGNFVAVDIDDSVTTISRIYGIIYDTQLVNPDFGSLGPRISTSEDIVVTMPDYITEIATLIGVFAIGWQTSDGLTYQGIPPITVALNGEVSTLDAEDVERFHQQENGGPTLAYVPILMNQNHPLVPQLLTRIVDQLSEHFPFHQNQLNILRNNFAWKSIVQPAG